MVRCARVVISLISKSVLKYFAPSAVDIRYLHCHVLKFSLKYGCLLGVEEAKTEKKHVRKLKNCFTQYDSKTFSNFSLKK